MGIDLGAGKQIVCIVYFWLDWCSGLYEHVSMFQVGRYKTVEMLAGDMELMFRNAMQYNIEDSKIYKVCSCYFILHDIVWG